MSLKWSPGCGCCGAAEECDCCVEQVLKPLPTWTAANTFDDSDWDAAWVGISDLTSNTLPAGTNAYIDVNLSCTDFIAVIEVLDTGTAHDSKVYIEDMQFEPVEDFANSSYTGIRAVAITRSSYAVYESVYGTTGTTFCLCPRYAAIQMGSIARAGAQESSIVVSRQETTRASWDSTSANRRVVSYCMSRGATLDAGGRTVRINIQSGTSAIKIGGVKIKSGWYSSSDACLSYDGVTGPGATSCNDLCTLGVNDAYYLIEGNTTTISGGGTYTITETSTNLEEGDAALNCNEGNETGCTWTNSCEVDLSIYNGTHDWLLERNIDFFGTEDWQAATSGEQTSVSNWITAFKADDWSTTRPIRFWEYRWIAPKLTLDADETWTDGDYVFTVDSAPGCSVSISVEDPNRPCGGDCSGSAPIRVVYPFPRYQYLPRTSGVIGGYANGTHDVIYCSSGTPVRPAFNVGNGYVTNTVHTIGLVIPYVALSTYDYANDAESAYNTLLEDTGATPWSVEVDANAVTITRSADVTSYAIPQYSDGGTPSGYYTARGVRITDFTWTDTADDPDTVENQVGNSYIPSVTYSDSSRPVSGSDPDISYDGEHEKRTGQPFGSTGSNNGVVRGTFFNRVDTTGDAFDVYIEVNLPYVRRYSDATVITGNSISLPSVDCDVIPCSGTDGTQSFSFNLRRG